MKQLKKFMLGTTWLSGIASACFVFAGFCIGVGRTMLGMSMGVLATSLLAMEYNVREQHKRDDCGEAYQAGYGHAQRHMRR